MNDNNDNDNDQPNQKRSLKKVRRSFLNRRLLEQDGNDLDALDPPLDDEIQGENLQNELNEEHNTTYIETKFINTQLNIESIAIEDDNNKSKIVTFNFEMNENSVLIPWEDTTKKIRVYGDINLVSWSQLFQEYLENFPQALEKTFKLLLSENQSTHADLRIAAMKARITCKKIEREYPYRRFEFFMTENMIRILTASFSEGFINQLGYSLEDFTSWIKFNGVPKLFASDSPINFGCFRDSFEYLSLNTGFIQEGPEYVICCNAKDGTNSCFVVQGVFISEPTPEGLFSTAYLILKGKAGEKRSSVEKNKEKVSTNTSNAYQNYDMEKKNEDNIF